MSVFIKSATAAVLVVTTLSFGGNASAAPLAASLALRDALTPIAQSVQWGGGYYGGGYGGYGDYGGYGGYGDYTGYGGYGGYGAYGGYGGNICCCPPGYGYNSSYSSYGSGYYGGYGYAPYYRSYGYAPRYRGYWGY